MYCSSMAIVQRIVADIWPTVAGSGYSCRCTRSAVVGEFLIKPRAVYILCNRKQRQFSCCTSRSVLVLCSVLALPSSTSSCVCFVSVSCCSPVQGGQLLTQTSGAASGLAGWQGCHKQTMGTGVGKGRVRGNFARVFHGGRGGGGRGSR